MPRKRKIEAEKRSKRLPVQMTLAELEDVRANAKEAGLSVSEFVRRRTAGRPTVPRSEAKLDAQVLSELNRLGIALRSGVGNNLNQIVRDWNSGLDARIDWDRTNKELQATLKRLDVVLTTVAEAYE